MTWSDGTDGDSAEAVAVMRASSVVFERSCYGDDLGVAIRTWWCKKKIWCKKKGK
jgi:hypothetical protein